VLADILELVDLDIPSFCSPRYEWLEQLIVLGEVFFAVLVT
jgi:hypothetical protein